MEEGCEIAQTETSHERALMEKLQHNSKSETQPQWKWATVFFWQWNKQIWYSYSETGARSKLRERTPSIWLPPFWILWAPVPKHHQ